MATPRSAGGRSCTDSPPMRISPAVGASSPAIRRSSVDLPQPDGPTKTMNSPSAMSRSSPRSTSVEPPKTLRTPRSWSSATAALPARGGHGLAVPQRAVLQRALLRLVVHVHDAEALVVARVPLVVVHQAPVVVAADVHARLAGARQGLEVAPHVV